MGDSVVGDCGDDVFVEARASQHHTQRLIMTTINTDYNNTELLDQELTVHALGLVSGGLDVLEPTTPEEEEELREMEAWWRKRNGF